MRLIDADKFRHELIMNGDLVGAKYTDMADTVEAIPVEWIKKYMDKVEIEDYGMVYLSPSGPFREMLKEWEEQK